MMLAETARELANVKTLAGAQKQALVGTLPATVFAVVPGTHDEVGSPI